MFRESDFMGTKADRRLLAEVYDQLREEKKAEAAVKEQSTTGLPGDSTD